jgi:hypothetical protein
LLGGEDVLVFDEARCLQAQSAGAEPFVVGQALDENTFGFGSRLMFRCEAGAEFGEFLGIFVGEEVERLAVVLAKTMAGAVAGRRLFADV